MTEPIDYHSTEKIAAQCGVTTRTVRRLLRKTFPSHGYGEWWRLDTHEYEFVCGELRAAKERLPTQPLRVLNRGFLIPFA